MKMKRLELILAISAVVISLSALTLSFTESRRSSEYKRLSVIPHLKVIFYHADFVGWDIINDGLGPAKIKYFKIFSDGKEVSHPYKLRKLHHLDKYFLWSLPTSGTWHKVGRRPIFKFKKNSDSANKLISGLRNRISFKVCYCSIYDDCWLYTKEVYNELPSC